LINISLSPDTTEDEMATEFKLLWRHPMQKLFLFTLLLTILFLGTVRAEAANHYIRGGATGSAPCSDWTTANACNTLPATLIRGDTYYVAGGTYPSYTFSTAPSGTTRIIVKKATVADHGTATGWLDTYGTTQAVWNAPFRWTTSNWTFDGGYRNEGNWFDGAAYGFRVENNGADELLMIKSQSNPTSNITIQHVYIKAKVGGLGSVQSFCRCAVNTDNGEVFINTGLVFSHMGVFGSNNVWLLRNTDGAILEYSASEQADGNDAYHGDLINLYYTADNAIIRFNNFRDEYTISCGNCGSTGIIPACCGTQNIQVYGNVVTGFRGGDGFVGYLDPTCSKGCVNGSVIYNNTIDSCSSASGGSGGINIGPTNNLIYNNIWTNCGNIPFQFGTHDYNAFADSSTHGEANAQTNFSTSNFVNYAGRDFRLKSGTTGGKTLAAPFNKDSLLVTRGADGVWDRGAIEFSTGGADVTPPAIPTNLVIR
jgi:hypothetical protein